ncbi:MAG: PGF-pre-PGF domain-containing protein, partial [Nanoarchaeota archaeon]
AAATTTTTTSSGSSGGGVVPPEPTIASTSRSWDTLAADSTGTFKISSGGIAFTNIVIAVANTVSNPTVGVSSLTSNPQSSTPSDNVYQYLKITHTNIADGDISRATISFKVPKSWLTANGVAEGDVTLYRYNSGQWNALSTAMTSSDADNVWFGAVTPGFSYYAVGGKAGGSGAFAIIDMIREFYAGTSTLTAFDIIDKIRAFYGG